MKRILAIVLFALMGCQPPATREHINYNNEVNEDEYDDSRFDRFKYEQAIPEYKNLTEEEMLQKR